jgi:hypothetical protein
MWRQLPWTDKQSPTSNQNNHNHNKDNKPKQASGDNHVNLLLANGWAQQITTAPSRFFYFTSLHLSRGCNHCPIKATWLASASSVCGYQGNNLNSNAHIWLFIVGGEPYVCITFIALECPSAKMKLTILMCSVKKGGAPSPRPIFTQ